MANTFTRKLQQDVGTSFTVIDSYVVQSNTQVTVIGLTVANTFTTSIEVDVTVYDGASDTFVVKGAPVPVGGSLVVIGGEQKVVLNPGDSIRVRSSETSSADVVMSVLEIT